ncbi:MAG: HINT domain-containing protein [Planctomycetaceae bacterium]|jgi:hypothetical protein|nr:HINT domain-containing protein [Planctomycetaceae bacterium]
MIAKWRHDFCVVIYTITPFSECTSCVKISVPEITFGKPGYGNFTFVDVSEYLPKKAPTTPEPAAPSISGVGNPLPSESAWWAGTKAFFGSLGNSFFDMGNHLTFGTLDSERYHEQVQTQGERLYNISKNLGYSDESIAKGYGLAQGLAGEVVGTNNLAEGITGYDLGENRTLDGWERAEKLATGGIQAMETVLGGATATRSLLKSCFLAGTVVSKYSPDNINERELVPIENIRFGDQVWSYNRTTKHWEPRSVLDTFSRNYIGDVVAISIWNEIIDATGGHPFWVLHGENLENRPPCDCLPTCDQGMTPDGRWVYARNLQVDDVVRSRSFGTQKVSGLVISQTETLVYNFLVDDLHCYAVGYDEILVHNTNSPKTEKMKPGKGGWDEGGYGEPVRNGDYKTDLGKAKAEIDTNELFRDFLHNKKDDYISRGGSRYNPNVNDDALVDIYRRWLSGEM